MTAEDDATHRAINAVWRIESPKLIAGLARLVRDVGLAEELAQDALVTALERWPETGVPENPGAWLMTAAKNRALDQLRQRKMAGRKHEELGRDVTSREATGAEEIEAAVDDDIGDDLLRLVFTACHPVLSTEARVALTLKLLGGLTTAEIARAFLAPEATVAQRIVRAKRTLGEAQVPFEVPRGAEREARLASVLEVIYLIFNEGYAATAGDDWMRPTLCEEALRLGRIVAELAPGETEVHGLVALMEIQASRARARTRPGGEPILLLEQNRALWDRLLIRRGLAALERATALGGAPGPRTCCRPRSAAQRTGAPLRRPADTDWARIVGLLRSAAPPHALPHRRPQPRRVAVSMASRAGRGPRRSWTPSRTTAPWPPTTCCRACAAICSRSWGETARRAKNSSAPPG